MQTAVIVHLVFTVMITTAVPSVLVVHITPTVHKVIHANTWYAIYTVCISGKNLQM